jgi:hypothetical protein
VVDTVERVGWGPEQRPGAVAVTVDVGDPPPPPGVLAALLDHLDRRSVLATWFVADNTDPVLVDRLYFGRHEVAALVPWPHLAAKVSSLRARDIDPVVGARLVPDGDPVEATAPRFRLTFAVAASLELTYLSIDPGVLRPGSSLPEEARALPVLVAPGVGALADDPHAWLRAVQVDVGRAIERGGRAELRIDPAALDRPRSFGVVAEAVDLVAGLARAGRVHLGRMRELVADDGPEAAPPG